MPDDVSRLIGKLEAGFDALAQRIDRSDEQTDAKFRALAETHANDRQAAIQARNEKEAREDVKHVQNQGAMKEMREALDGTATIARDNRLWIDTIGKPLVTRVDNIHDRVTAIEDGRRMADAEERGAGKTWALVGGAVVTGGSAVGGLIGYWRDIVDFVRGIGH